MDIFFYVLNSLHEKKTMKFTQQLLRCLKYFDMNFNMKKWFELKTDNFSWNNRSKNGHFRNLIQIYVDPQFEVLSTKYESTEQEYDWEWQ